MLGAAYRFDTTDGAGSLTEANLNSLDMGGNVTQTPGQDLQVNVSALELQRRDAAAPALLSYAGASAQAVTASQTNYFWLTAAGALTKSTSSFPDPLTTDHFRLAQVVCSASEITSITDKRPKATVHGQQAQLRVYTVATLPSAATAGQQIYVSDETGGAQTAFSDGTNWRRGTDRAIVS